MKKYTLLQMERRIRANVKGARTSLANDLRKAAKMLERAGTKELSEDELSELKDIKTLVGLIIVTDGLTKDALRRRKKV